MTTDLEKQFFDTFGIEPIEEKYCYWECKKPELENVACNNTECEHYRYKIHYQQITDHILLELICITSGINPITIRGIKEIELLKNSILLTCIAHKEAIKQSVQALFKEE